MMEERYGKSTGYEQAYLEGYSSRHDQWELQDNPYPMNTEENAGYAQGQFDASDESLADI